MARRRRGPGGPGRIGTSRGNPTGRCHHTPPCPAFSQVLCPGHEAAGDCDRVPRAATSLRPGLKAHGPVALWSVQLPRPATVPGALGAQRPGPTAACTRPPGAGGGGRSPPPRGVHSRASAPSGAPARGGQEAPNGPGPHPADTQDGRTATAGSRSRPVRLSTTRKNQTGLKPLPGMISAPSRPGPQPKPRAAGRGAVPRPSRPAPRPPDSSPRRQPQALTSPGGSHLAARPRPPSPPRSQQSLGSALFASLRPFSLLLPKGPDRAALRELIPIRRRGQFNLSGSARALSYKRRRRAEAREYSGSAVFGSVRLSLGRTRLPRAGGACGERFSGPGRAASDAGEIRSRSRRPCCGGRRVVQAS